MPVAALLLGASARMKGTPSGTQGMSHLKRLSIRTTLLGSFVFVVLAMLLLAWWGHSAVRDTRQAGCGQTVADGSAAADLGEPHRT